MEELALIEQYNYDAFVPGKFERWHQFEASPALGQPAPDFPLWHLDGEETRLWKIVAKQTLTIVEFGSFT